MLLTLAWRRYGAERTWTHRPACCSALVQADE